MADEFGALDDQIRRLRGLAELPERAAAELAPRLEHQIRADIAAARSPAGDAWAPRKTGGAALAGAAKALVVRAVRGVVVAILTGPEALHSLGRARGGVRRQILPESGAEPSVQKAAEEAADRAFERWKRG